MNAALLIAAFLGWCIGLGLLLAYVTWRWER